MILTGKNGKREEKCLQKARKQLNFHRRWGKYAGCFSAFFALFFIGMGIFWWWYAAWIINNLWGNNNQAQNAINQALALGTLFGFMSGFLLFKGAHYLFEAIKTFRGDTSDHLLVLYHDLLVELTQKPEEQSDNAGKPES